MKLGISHHAKQRWGERFSELPQTALFASLERAVEIPRWKLRLKRTAEGDYFRVDTRVNYLFDKITGAVFVTCDGWVSLITVIRAQK